MNKSILLDIIPVDQFKNTGDEKWASRSCAIACLKMVLAYKNPEYNQLKIMVLIKEALALDGYIDGVGFKHKSLVDVAKKYNLAMEYQKIFFYSPEEKENGLKIIDEEISKKQPVIISIKSQISKGSHMVVVRGLDKNSGEVSGYYIQDPDPRWKGSQYYLDKKSFIQIWRGGMLWIK